MAWTTPMTAVNNATWTAAQWNTHVRDNLLETMAGKATAANRWYIATGTNAIAERVPSFARVETLETTTSTTFTALTTPGPAVTVTTGTRALVHIAAWMLNSSANEQSVASVAVSGATTIAAGNDRAIMMDGVLASRSQRWGMTTLFDNLNAGSNTFTMQYRVSAGTGSFRRREIVVLPL